MHWAGIPKIVTGTQYMIHWLFVFALGSIYLESCQGILMAAKKATII